MHCFHKEGLKATKREGTAESFVVALARYGTASVLRLRHETGFFVIERI